MFRGKLLCIIEVNGQNFIKNGLTVKVKIMFTLEQAAKAQSGGRGIALLFL